MWKAYQDRTETELVNLDEADGWTQLVNLCDSKPDSVVVINTATRNNQGVSAYGETLSSTLGELQRQLVTLWVINRERDSLELLKGYKLSDEPITKFRKHRHDGVSIKTLMSHDGLSKAGVYRSLDP